MMTHFSDFTDCDRDLSRRIWPDPFAAPEVPDPHTLATYLANPDSLEADLRAQCDASLQVQRAVAELALDQALLVPGSVDIPDSDVSHVLAHIAAAEADTSPQVLKFPTPLAAGQVWSTTSELCIWNAQALRVARRFAYHPLEVVVVALSEDTHGGGALTADVVACVSEFDLPYDFETELPGAVVVSGDTCRYLIFPEFSLTVPANYLAARGDKLMKPIDHPLPQSSGCEGSTLYHQIAARVAMLDASLMAEDLAAQATASSLQPIDQTWLLGTLAQLQMAAASPASIDFYIGLANQGSVVAGKPNVETWYPVERDPADNDSIAIPGDMRAALCGGEPIVVIDLADGQALGVGQCSRFAESVTWRHTGSTLPRRIGIIILQAD